MVPGPKKKNFHSPRNPKNVPNNKEGVISGKDSSHTYQNSASFSSLESESSSNRKYSKRSLESNWNKYEEKQSDLHSDDTKGNEFEVLLTYSGGTGSHLKLQEEKDWENDYLNDKEISLNFQDLINAMNCIPFHERINAPNVFEEKHINNFILISNSWNKKYMPYVPNTETLPEISAEKENVDVVDSDLKIVETSESMDLEEAVKTFVVTEKTTNIVNALASNLVFKDVPDKVKDVPDDMVKPEGDNNDLDFLLSLNISSAISLKSEGAATSKASTVDDWLNSILDD